MCAGPGRAHTHVLVDPETQRWQSGRGVPMGGSVVGVQRPSVSEFYLPCATEWRRHII